MEDQPRLRYSQHDEGGETYFAIEGTLDAGTAPELRSVVDALVNAKPQELVLDLSSVRMIDDSGVGVILSLFQRIRANGGQMRIVGLRGQPRAIIRQLRLDRVLPV